MVGHAADLNEAAPLAPDDAAHVLVEALADILCDQRAAVFGAEDEVIEEVGEGIGHREPVQPAYQI
jgi:hypothetical protein